jgi:Fe-S oxidoreductase
MLVLGLLALLMAADMFFQASLASAQIQAGTAARFMFPGTGVWFAKLILGAASPASLQSIHIGGYFLHSLVFFTLLCLFPFGRFFHLVTSIPNLMLMNLDKGKVKPVMWGIDDDKLDELESFGVKTFEDFTWKHMLDFYSCADCGRCSDNCPANAVGRPLSPRFISIKGRQYAWEHYPVFGGRNGDSPPLIGEIYSEDEIWSCTTCGACEEECPLMIQYIDKMVDLRRAMVDEGMVPQSLQKPLSALEKRGNPWGKMEKKRADWTKTEGFAEMCQVKILGKKASADMLYFVDSITSFDDRILEIGQATARVLTAAGIDFGILGPAEKDSGHEVRRFGEEMLFQELRDHNSDAIMNSGVTRIVTTDPHALNALKNDYTDMPPVEHVCQVMAAHIESGGIRLKKVEDDSRIYTYHDPCYLGRHNGIYDEPRAVIDAVPGIRRVEMLPKCRDRSFCCSGGGLMLFYEPEEEQRMGVLRVEMAKDAGANVIVTACPFCMVNIEDAIKVSGLEGSMEVIDLVELIDRHLEPALGGDK